MTFWESSKLVCDPHLTGSQALQNRVKTSLLHHFSIATALVFLTFGSIYLVLGIKIPLGVFEVLLGLAQLLNLLYLRRSANILFSSRFLVASVYFMSLLIFLTGGLGNTGYLWLLFIPLFTMLLLERSEAIGWLAAYTVIVALVVSLFLFNRLELPYTVAELRQSLIVYGLIIYLTYHNEKLRSISNEMLQHKNRLLHELTRKDPLTGLHNRGHINEVLKAAFERAKREGQVFSIVMVDIDHFKQINDNHGHHIGDQVLKLVSDLFEKNTDDHASVGRWGGEEFVIVCPESTQQKAMERAQTLCKQIAEHDFGVGKPVTASFGVISYRASFPTFEAMLVAADDQLYQAKNSGRNCVICSAE